MKKKEMKKGERMIAMGAQERYILVHIINQYIDQNKKAAQNNHILKRQLTYLDKTISKLLRKKRCVHCGNWI
jgi:hypothetical protein